MKTIPTAAIILLAALSGAGFACADIYVWTDADGIKHITNYAPPEQAEILVRAPEIPYDAEADRQRREAERREQLARERLELAEREAQLELLEREAKARIDAAEQWNREMRAYEKGLADQSRSKDESTRTYWYGGSLWNGKWGRHPLPRSGYYRKDGSIYYGNRYPHHYKELKGQHHQKRPAESGSATRYHSSPRREPSSVGRYPYKGPQAHQRRY